VLSEDKAIFRHVTVCVVVLAKLILSPCRIISPHWSGALEIVLVLDGFHDSTLWFVEDYIDGPGFVSFNGLLLVRFGGLPGAECVSPSPGLTFVEWRWVAWTAVAASVTQMAGDTGFGRVLAPGFEEVPTVGFLQNDVFFGSPDQCLYGGGGFKDQ
jgi:hypothetical protein